MASQHEEMSDQDELIADLLGQGWTHKRVADSVDVSSKPRSTDEIDAQRVAHPRKVPPLLGEL